MPLLGKDPDGNRVEVYENSIEAALFEVFREFRDDGDDATPGEIRADILNAPQSVFNAALYKVGRRCFHTPDGRRVLLDRAELGKSNRYDYAILRDLADFFIYLCGVYAKECTPTGFCNMTGISYDIFNDWINSGDGGKVTPGGFHVAKMIITARENSLSDMLVSGRRNPVGVLGVLNHHYSWNLPGVSREIGRRAALPSADLPRLMSADDGHDAPEGGAAGIVSQKTP